ncbi:unnamed protein product [Nesidiocoris tenuis]|uniref:Uncharacterized protein n=1 Tax=Nesidiocoris tenuis TaxID=355587 RepID=A0A6H5GVN4_9HEMI|nr:unnamed protein product [Nesidiocoris tenuis]
MGSAPTQPQSQRPRAPHRRRRITNQLAARPNHRDPSRSRQRRPRGDRPYPFRSLPEAVRQDAASDPGGHPRLSTGPVWKSGGV